MSTLTVRKNFKFDKEMIDKVSSILQKRDLNFTQFISKYFQAVIKDPALIELIEQKSKQRTGEFIGVLDNKIGDVDYKEMKKIYNENFS